MNILVVGCGNVGSYLASRLEEQGHDVSVIAQTISELNNLKDFSGFSVIGVPIDTDVLHSVGIENSDVVLAVTSNDNMNLMVSQMASEIYKIKQVVARVFDKSKQNVYAELNIQTMCTTDVSANVIIDMIK